MRFAKPLPLLTVGVLLAGGCMLAPPPLGDGGHSQHDLGGLQNEPDGSQGQIDPGSSDLALGAGDGSVAPTGVDLGGDSAMAGPVNNVVPITVDDGPTGDSYNTPFISIKVCAPGSTTNCQTITHVSIDTASVGLRVISSTLSTTLSALPAVTVSSKNLTECFAFAGGFSYGSVRTADLYIGGEKATSLPIVALGDPTYAVPADCSMGQTDEDTAENLGANAILGAGFFSPDCGTDCTVPSNPAAPINPIYFGCTGTTCAEIGVPVATQVPNPVAKFASDNNGVIVQLPSVPDNGAVNPSGSLVFGIGTRDNNSLTGLTIYPATVSDGLTTISATIGSTTYASTYFDSGTTDIAFTGSALPECTEPQFADYLCPTSPTTFTASLQGSGSGSGSLTFKVADPSTLLATGTAFNDTASTGFANAQYFAFGLPAFFGHHIAFAFSGATTPSGTGPFFGL